MLRLKKLKKNKYNIQYLLINIGMSIFFISCILGIAFLFNKIIESIIMLISYLLYRSAFEKELHMPTLEKCIKTTLSIFFISIMSLVPNEFSFILPIISGFIICYVTYKIQDYLDYITKRNTKLYRGMTNDEFKNICEVCVLENEELKILYLYFVKKFKIWEIANELKYSESSIFKKKATAINKIKLLRTTFE